MELSIIIPVYNTPEAALQRCFDSVTGIQNITWEAVIVDDGSREETGAFCRAYGQRHPEFRYIRQENGGVSAARNRGLSVAEGNYIMFLDADDELLPEAILPEHCGGTDLVLYDMQLREKDREQTWHSLETQKPVDRELLLHSLLTGKSLNSPCVKLFKKSLIDGENLRFDTGYVTGEDWLFVSRFTQLAQSVTYVRACCYRYYREQGTDRSRVLRFPDRVLDNHRCRFFRRIEIAEKTQWTRYAPDAMLSAAAAELTEDVFNAAGELLLAHQLTAQRKQLVKDTAAEAGRYLLPEASKKTKLKKWVLTSGFCALWPLACLRALYLKLKR